MDTTASALNYRIMEDENLRRIGYSQEDILLLNFLKESNIQIDLNLQLDYFKMHLENYIHNMNAYKNKCEKLREDLRMEYNKSL